MLEYIITVSLLIAAVILIRGIFRKRISARLIYALWLAVIIRLILPINLISIDLPFPAAAEIGTAFTEAYEGHLAENADSPTVPATPDSFKATDPSSSEPPSDTAYEESISTPDTFTPIKESPDARTVILIVWASGSAITLTAFALPLFISYSRIRRSKRFHSTAGKTKVYVSDRVSSPCVMGIKPRIYITPDAEKCKDLSFIILHEKTHIRHGDHLWSIIRILLLIAFWWNPAIWAAALLSKRDAEVACDESVVKCMDERSRISYSRLIVDMIPQRGGFVVAFSNKPIKYRVLRLTGKFKTTIAAAIITTTAISLAFSLAFVSNSVDDGKNAVIHIHRYKEKATCTAAATCACGETKGKPLGHKWKEASCSSPKTCKRCNITDGAPLEHTWNDASCDLAKTCSSCKATVGEHLQHIYTEATCLSPAYCTLCNKTSGKALGHSFADATCLSPKTCIRCQLTKGEAIGHIWTDATCTAAKTCTVCNTTDGTPLGHRFQFESCTVCRLPSKQFLSKLKDSEGILNNSLSKNGISKTGFSSYLASFGYTNAEIEYIIEKLDPDWNIHAEKAAAQCRKSYGLHSSEGIYYTKKLIIIKLLERGFTMEEAEHGYKYISEVSPSANNTFVHPDPFIYIYDWYK